MVTKEPRDGDEETAATSATGDARGPGSGSRASSVLVTYRLSAERYDELVRTAEEASLSKARASQLLVEQGLQRAHLTARRVQVIVPDEVRREVRATQEALNEAGVATNRIGRNLLVQLQRHWSGDSAEGADLARMADALERVEQSQREVAEQLRTVLSREAW